MLLMAAYACINISVYIDIIKVIMLLYYIIVTLNNCFNMLYIEYRYFKLTFHNKDE